MRGDFLPECQQMTLPQPKRLQPCFSVRDLVGPRRHVSWQQAPRLLQHSVHIRNAPAVHPSEQPSEEQVSDVSQWLGVVDDVHRGRLPVATAVHARTQAKGGWPLGRGALMGDRRRNLSITSEGPGRKASRARAVMR